MSESTTLLPAPTTPEASTKPPKPRRSNQMHGLSRLIRGRLKADAWQLDGRSAFSQAMSQYKADLIADLGGKENLSTAELTMIDMCAKDWLILQSIDSYLFQAGLFNRRKKSAYALTIQRGQIADSLTRKLQAVGLKRRAAPRQSLQDILAGLPEPTEGGTL